MRRRKLTVILVLVCGLIIVQNPAFTQNIEFTDIYVTPETNPHFFSGLAGGDGNKITDQWLDWTIGNGTPFISARTDDMIFSTCIGNFKVPDNWFERMRITKDGNVSIGTTSPGATLDVKGNPASALKGTLTVAAGSKTVSGSGTVFTTELTPGSAIKIGSEVFTVISIADDTNLTIDTAHSAGALNVTAFKNGNLLNLQNGKGVSKLMVDGNTGNIGIGTTSPEENLTVVGTNNLNPSFPDGLQGSIKNINLTPDNSYTVPNGKTLYILTMFSSNVNRRILFIDGIEYAQIVGFESMASPIVVPAGSTISASNLRLTGIETNTGVTIRNINLTPGNSYTVPNGKTLYILTMFSAGANRRNIFIDGIEYAQIVGFESMASPIVVPADSTISASIRASDIRLTGYER